MTWELPWITAGVNELPITAARVLAYAATDGNSGVVGPNDLKITATGTPSAQVSTAPGVMVATTAFTGASYESYTARNTSSVLTTVPSTGGTSRYDFVYAHVIDPGQTGQPSTAGPVETRVVTGVSSTATRMSDVPSLAGQTGVPLARIFRGPSASIVNQSDITDIRPFLSTGMVGEITMWPTVVPPSGWLLCNGQAVSRVAYSALFAVLGTTFGAGDGGTTFNLPNFVDRNPIGWGAKTLGTYGGNEAINIDHAHTVGNHTHSIATDSIPKDTAGNTSTQSSGGAPRVVRLGGAGNDGNHNHGGATGTSGAGNTSAMTANAAINIRNPYTVVSFIIRAV